MAVVAIDEPHQDLTQAHPVLDWETFGYYRVPTNVGELVNIHEDDEADEYGTEHIHLFQNIMLHLQWTKALDLFTSKDGLEVVDGL